MYLLVVVALVSAFWLLFDPAGLLANDAGQAICEATYGQGLLVNADYIGCLLDESQQRELLDAEAASHTDAADSGALE